MTISDDRRAPAPRVQVVVAHPDDETFGCGALLLHARALGAVTGVVCATRGEAGESRVRHADLGSVREAELRRAAELLGVERVDVLDFADSDMSGAAGPATLWGADESAVVDAVLAPVLAFAPDVLVTLDASDGHRDHQRMRDVVMRVADLAGVPRVYVSCLSRSLMRRWSDHQQEVNPDSPYLDVDEVELGTPDDTITTIVDVRAHRSDLDRAMAAHASQASPYTDLPDRLTDDFLDTARARRVVPAWQGGPLESMLLEPRG